MSDLEEFRAPTAAWLDAHAPQAANLPPGIERTRARGRAAGRAVGVTGECDGGFARTRARAAAVRFGDAAPHRGRWARLGGD